VRIGEGNFDKCSERWVQWPSLARPSVWPEKISYRIFDDTESRHTGSHATVDCASFMSIRSDVGSQTV
jgi:hypothetical protein